jgi:TIR domain
MGGVFISYRREGSSAAAKAISDQLKIQLGTKNVFIDVADITPGSDWRDTLVSAVVECEMLLAIIGVNWITCATPIGVRRIDDENDYLRIEIETALTRNIPVIPVLVERALLPGSDCLPDTLKKLPFRQGSTITSERFESDIQVLVSDVGRILSKRREDANGKRSLRIKRNLNLQ